MSRLYYEPKQKKGINPVEPPQSNNNQEYFEKIAKLIPAEIIAAYIAIVGLIPAINDPKTELIVLAVVFALGVVGTPIYLRSMAEKGQPIKMHLVLSTIAFVVWGYSISGYLIPEIHNAAIASIILIVFSVISGRIPLDS